MTTLHYTAFCIYIIRPKEHRESREHRGVGPDRGDGVGRAKALYQREPSGGDIALWAAHPEDHWSSHTVRPKWRQHSLHDRWCGRNAQRYAVYSVGDNFFRRQLSSALSLLKKLSELLSHFLLFGSSMWFRWVDLLLFRLRSYHMYW